LTAPRAGQQASISDIHDQAYHLITQDDRGVPIPYYAMQNWTILQSPAEFLTEFAFRQASWVSQSQGRSIEVDLHLSDLSRWCNLSSQHLDQVISQGKYINWFVSKKVARNNRKSADRWEVYRDIPIAPHQLWAIDQYVKQTLPEWKTTHGNDISGYLDDLGERVFWILSRSDPANASQWIGGRSSILEIIQAAAGAPLSEANIKKCASIQARVLHISHQGSDRARNSFWCTHYFLEHCLPILGSQMAVAVLRLRFLKESGQIVFPLMISESKSGYQYLGELMGVDFRTARKWINGLTSPASEKRDPKLDALGAFITSLPMGRDVISVDISMDDPVWADEIDLLTSIYDMLGQEKSTQEIAKYIATQRRKLEEARNHESKSTNQTNTFMRIERDKASHSSNNDFHEGPGIDFHDQDQETMTFMSPSNDFHEGDKVLREDETNPFMKQSKSFHESSDLINKDSLNQESINQESIKQTTNQLAGENFQFAETEQIVGWYVDEILQLFTLQRIKPRTEKYTKAVSYLKQDDRNRLRLVAWIIWAYERYKKDGERWGIVSPELYAIEQIPDSPQKIYLSLAELSPADLLEDIRHPYQSQIRKADSIYRKLSDTPLVRLLEELVPEENKPLAEPDDELLTREDRESIEKDDAPGKGEMPNEESLPEQTNFTEGLESNEFGSNALFGIDQINLIHKQESLQSTEPDLIEPFPEKIVMELPNPVMIWNSIRSFIETNIKGMPTQVIDNVLVLKVYSAADANQTKEHLEEHLNNIQKAGLVKSIVILPFKSGDFEPLSVAIEAENEEISSEKG
jgi:hypothetical protein